MAKNSNFPYAFQFVLKAEGGYSDHPADRGGSTNYGITIGTLQSLAKRDKAWVESLGIVLPVKSTATVSEENRFERGKDFQVSTYGERIRRMHDSATEDEQFLNVYLLSSFCFGDIYTRAGLSLKDRELLTCAVIALIGGAEAQLTSHVRAAFSTGNSKRDLVDALALCLPYMGFPRSLNALAVVKKVEAERKAP